MDNSSSNSKMLLKVSTIDNNSVSSTFDEQAGAMTTDALANYSEESVEDLKATAKSRQRLLPSSLLMVSSRVGRPLTTRDWRQKQTTITAQLSADGVLKGRQTTHYEGLAAMNYRQAKGIRAFASEAVEETDLTVKGQTDGGIIRICPFTASMAHNAFIESERMIPVEFPSISTETIVLNITLPKGYTFGGHSRNTSLATPDKGLECLLQTTATGGKIQMTCQLRVNKLIYYDKNYKDLRQIFEMIAAYTSEELVVKK